jgi:hypothetical protein
MELIYDLPETQHDANWRYIEIVKGQWKPVVYIESDGNLVLSEI